MAAFGKAAALRVPELLALTCIFIREKFLKGLRKVPCGGRELELGELFGTDAKCIPGKVVLGGWMLGERAAPAELTPTGYESSWASTSAELLRSLVALKVFKVGDNFKHLAASHVIRCGGGTDNKAASAVTSRRLRAKLPFIIILMEYLGTCEEI